MFYFQCSIINILFSVFHFHQSIFIILFSERNETQSYFHNLYFNTTVHCVLKDTEGYTIPAWIEILEDDSGARCVQNNGDGRLDPGIHNIIFITQEVEDQFRFDNVNVEVAVERYSDALQEDLMETCLFNSPVKPDGESSGADAVCLALETLACDGGSTTTSGAAWTLSAAVMTAMFSMLR